MTAATDIEVYENIEEVVPAAPSTLFRSDEPSEVAQRAIETADALMHVVNQRRKDLIATISGKDYPQVECWTLLGTLLGVFPVCEWTRPLVSDDGKNYGWEARVVAKTRDGAVVGAAESMCTRSERTWANRDDFALRGMAESRATSRALRKPLGFVMKLAGLEATAAEEMDAPAAPVDVPPTPVAPTEADEQAVVALVAEKAGDVEAFKTAMANARETLPNYPEWLAFQREHWTAQPKAFVAPKVRA